MIVVLPTVVEEAEKLSSLNRDALMMVTILLLGGVIIFLFRDAKKTATKVGADHALSMEKMVARMEERTASMDLERRERIKMLIDIIKENTAAKVEMSEAVRNNTGAVTELRGFLETVVITNKK